MADAYPPDARLRAVAGNMPHLPLEQGMGELRRFRSVLDVNGIRDLGQPIAFAPELDIGVGPHWARWDVPAMVTTDYLVLPIHDRRIKGFPLEGARLMPPRHLYNSWDLPHAELKTSKGNVVLYEGEYQPGECDRILAAILAAADVRSLDAARTAARGTRPARPPLRLIRSASEAELVAAEWMTYLGFGRASVTPPGVDGGLDVVAEAGVAQVKVETLPTGRPVVQQLVGAAVAEGKQPVFFSLAGFTAEASNWADRAGVALFRFDFQGEPEPVNGLARDLVTAAE